VGLERSTRSVGVDVYSTAPSGIVKTGVLRRIWLLWPQVGGSMDLHMLRYQSYKFELRPTGEQLRWMRRIAGCCRFVFNLALATQKDRVETGLAELDFARLSAQLLAWRRQPEGIWLADVPIGYLQQALRNLGDRTAFGAATETISR